MTQPPAHEYHCPWCGLISPAGKGACPSCGAPEDIRAVQTGSGWLQMPPIKDMARLQFGRSSCQIEGKYVPVADMNLDAADSVYFTHHVLLWKDPEVRIEAMPLQGGWKRVLAGLPLIMTHAFGPGHIAFSQDDPGEILALPLERGQSIDIREHVFLVATGNVQYQWLQTGVWYRTEGEFQYPAGQYLDRFTASEQHGFVLIHGGGNCFVRQLGQNQSILLKPTALLYKDPTVSMRIYIEHPNGYNNVWSRRYIWLQLFGPGRVAIQSRYPHWEDPSEPVIRGSQGMVIYDW